MEKIAIIIPTRNRYTKLIRALKNLDEVDWLVKEIVVVCDDDKETYDKIKHFEKRDLKVFLTPRLEFVKALRVGIEKAESEFFIYYNDDMMMDRHCLFHAMSEFKNRFKDGIGLVAFNDGINKFAGAVGITTKKTMKMFDLFAPLYIHYFSDTEAALRTGKVGCFTWCKEAIVEHVHPLTGKAENDETYAESHKSLQADTVHFIGRNGIWTHEEIFKLAK